MSFRLLLSCLLFLSFSGVYAQDISKSNPEKFTRKPYSKIIGQTDSTFIVVKSLSPFNSNSNQLKFKDNKIEISCFDFELEQKWNTPILFQLPNALIEHLMVVNDKIHVFFSSVNKEESLNVLYVSTIDVGTGALIGSALKLDEISYDRKRYKGSFFISTSKDYSKILLFHTDANTRSDETTWYFSVLDKDMKILWNNVVSISDLNKNLNIYDLVVDNVANVFVLTADNLSTERSLPPRSFKVFKAENLNKEMKEFIISIPNKVITDVRISIDNLNKKAIVAGFYSDGNSFSSAGVVYASIDIEKEGLPVISTHSFKAKFVSGFQNDRSINRGAELINYNIDQLILRSDGGVVLIAESNFVTESSNYNSYYQLYTTNYTYHFDNVLVMSVNPDGKIDWEGILRKDQISENDEGFYSSFATFIVDDEIHFIFNKSISRRTDVINFSINNQGETNEKILFKNNEEIQIMPKGSKQVSANEIIIPCIDRNRSNLIKVAF